MSSPTTTRSRRAAACLLLASVLSLACAAPASADAASDAVFVQRLHERSVVSGIVADGATVVVHALARLEGSDDQALIDVATVLLRVHEQGGATGVEFRRANGARFARYAPSAGLVRD